MVTFVVIWAVLAVIVVSLAVWRNLVGMHEDDTVHIADAAASREQASIAGKISVLDRWGKSLTVVTIVYGTILVSIKLFNAWVESGTRLPL
jgi:hypothetical protein